MTSIEIEQSVNAPRDALWTGLADLASHPTWMTDAEKVVFLSTQTSGVGTRMRVPTRIGPFATTDILEIVEWVEGRSMKVDHRGIVRGSGEFLVSGDLSKSKIVWREQLRFPWWWGGPIAARVAKPVLRHIWRGNLRRLARLIEGAGPDES